MTFVNIYFEKVFRRKPSIHASWLKYYYLSIKEIILLKVKYKDISIKDTKDIKDIINSLKISVSEVKISFFLIQWKLFTQETEMKFY